MNSKNVFLKESCGLTEPFIGIRTAAGIEHGLFQIRSTGVITRPVVAATHFLNTLDPEQHIKTVYEVDDPAWSRWCNVDNGIYVRQGISLKEMTEIQKEAAVDLMRHSLSTRGLQLTEAIRHTDHILREINNSLLEYDEDLYFFTVMEIPSESEPWGWQIDGHHLVINYFVLGDQVVMTPAFLGGEPIKTTTGKYKGNTLFQAEQNKGLAFYRMLDEKQKKKATLSVIKTGKSNQAEAFSDNVIIEFTGIPARELSLNQRTKLIELIRLYRKYA